MNDCFALTFPARGKHLKRVREWSRTLIGTALPPDRRDRLILALSEACANNIKHCCGNDASRTVQVEFDILRTAVIARVRNFCYAIHAHKIKPRKFQDIRPGGLGMRFIEESVDGVDYIAEGDGFLTLVLTKKRKGAPRGH